jgi:ABC-type multidrug transport system fused ATPase/permease subunit
MVKYFFSLLNATEKKKIYFLQLFVIILSFVEVFGILSILPFAFSLTSDSLEKIYISFPIIKSLFKDISILDLRIYFLLLFISLIIFYNSLFFFAQLYIEKILKSINTKIFNTILYNYLHSDYSAVVKRNSSELVSRLTHDVQLAINRIYRLIFRASVKFYSAIIIITLILIVDFQNSGLIILTIFPLIILTYLFIRKYLSRLGKLAVELNSKNLKNLNEVFFNYKSLIIDDLRSYFFKILSNNNFNYASTVEKIEIYTHGSRIFLESISFIALTILLIFYLYFKEVSLTITLISFFLFAFYRLLPAIQQLFFAYTNFKSWIHVLTGLHADSKLNNFRNKTYDNTSRIVPLLKKKITFSNVNFSYGKNLILRNICFNIPKGSITCISGPTGSGKSTILDLICGIKFPNRGNIFFDKKKLDRNNSYLFQKIIGFVPQNYFLLDDTVKNNVLLSLKNDKSTNINEENFKKIKKILEINSFIKNDNYLVGENANRLSNGQKQRLMIARALMKNPQILILDESTSGIENALEKKIIKKIKKQNCDLTIIIVSHRQDTLNYCDNLIQL